MSEQPTEVRDLPQEERNTRLGFVSVKVYLRYDYAGAQLRLVEAVTELDTDWRAWMEPAAVLLDRELLLDLKAAMARAVEMEQRMVRFLDLSEQQRPEVA